MVVIGWLASCSSNKPGPMPISLADVKQVRIEAVPEGPPAPVFEETPGKGNFPIVEILPYLPQPLPAPIPQSCDAGGNLTISFADGRKVVYGPCERPIEIDRLWWHYLDIATGGGCRPNCWAGGNHPPGEKVPPDAEM
jgi:hypothetical protein